MSKSDFSRAFSATDPATRSPRRNSSRGKPITIGLLWHSVNSDNLGIGALTAGHLAIIDAVARDLGIAVRYKIIGWRDPAPAYITRPDVTPAPLRARDVLRPGGLHATLRQCDVVLDISAGDSFADIYGARRFALNAAAKAVAVLARRPLVLSPQTVGPFERWWARWWAKQLMRRARKVVTRDSLSVEFLQPFKLGASLVEASDVAFRLPYDKAPRRSDGIVRVGLNVSGLLFNGGYTGRNMFALACDYPALARALVGHFAGLPDCEVHLIGHVNSHHKAVEDDYRVAERLAAEFPGAVVAPRFADPSAAKSYIATMDFFCGSRMHACIAAFSSGVPVVPIAYSRKFAGLFGSLGYTIISDCRFQNEAQVLDAVVEAFQHRHELETQLQSGLAQADARLAGYEAVLRETLSEVVCTRV